LACVKFLFVEYRVE